MLDLHQAAARRQPLDSPHGCISRTKPAVSTVLRAIVCAAAAVLLVPAWDAVGQQQAQSREQTQARTQERAGKREIIPGSELMTANEREDYRRRYAAAKTDAEREKVRSDHIKAMEVRARLRGLRLDLPAPQTGSGR